MEIRVSQYSLSSSVKDLSSWYFLFSESLGFSNGLFSNFLYKSKQAFCNYFFVSCYGKENNLNISMSFNAIISWCPITLKKYSHCFISCYYTYYTFYKCYITFRIQMSRTKSLIVSAFETNRCPTIFNPVKFYLHLVYVNVLNWCQLVDGFSSWQRCLTLFELRRVGPWVTTQTAVKQIKKKKWT